jgi:ATP-dependent Lhr-like helicase
MAELLLRDYELCPSAAKALADYFVQQESISEIPDGDTLLIECVSHDAGTAQYVHTPLSRPANDALARVAVHRLARDLGRSVTSVVADLGFALYLRANQALTVAEVRQVLDVQGFDADLATALAGSLTLRERFRRVALTGLMLLRNPLGGRRRVGGQDWAERRLFGHVVAAAPEFVLLRQAERDVRAECCDAEAARAFLGRLPGFSVRVRHLPTVSPFAASWTQEDAGPAESVENPADVLRRLHADLQRAKDHASTHGLAAHA